MLRLAKRELERLQQESAQIIRKAHGEAESIVSKSWSDAEKAREEMKQKAKTEADAIVKESQRQIELETGRALRQIRSEVADLSIAIASKVIQRNVSKEDNNRLDRRYPQADRLQPEQLINRGQIRGQTVDRIVLKLVESDRLAPLFYRRT